MASKYPPRPFQRFRELIQLDRKDLAVVLSYTLLSGVLALAVPLAAQALVNTIAVGVFLQPLVVLTVAVLALLLFRGALRLLKFYLIELLQQRVFMLVSLELAHHLPRIRQDALDDAYAPELANRFFDVLTIQKSWAKLLVEGPAALLQSLVGLTVMAFYSPLLLAFNVGLAFAGAFVVFVLGWGGVRTSIAESAEKYHVAHWLEDVGRCEQNLKFSDPGDYTVREADRRVAGYLAARQRHFRVLLRQAFGSYLLHAVASAGILAIGGILVIRGQLTMGQLVASELIVISVLAALEKLIGLAEPFYDLLTGLEKIGQVTDLPREKGGKVPVPQAPETLRIETHDLGFAYREGIPVLRDVSLAIEPGAKIGITGPSGAGKSTLLRLLTGVYRPKNGVIQLNGRSMREFDLAGLRDRLALVGERSDLFDGSIEANIRVGRRDVPEAELERVLALTGLDEDLRRLPEGLGTMVISEGQNLSRGQTHRLLIARALLGRPCMLFLDEAFRGVDPDRRRRILEGLVSEPETTLVIVSQDWEVLRAVDQVYYLREGEIAESAAPAAMSPETLTRRFLVGEPLREA